MFKIQNSQIQLHHHPLTPFELKHIQNLNSKAFKFDLVVTVSCRHVGSHQDLASTRPMWQCHLSLVLNSPLVPWSSSVYVGVTYGVTSNYGLNKGGESLCAKHFNRLFMAFPAFARQTLQMYKARQQRSHQGEEARPHAQRRVRNGLGVGEPWRHQIWQVGQAKHKKKQWQNTFWHNMTKHGCWSGMMIFGVNLLSFPHDVSPLFSSVFTSSFVQETGRRQRRSWTGRLRQWNRRVGCWPRSNVTALHRPSPPGHRNCPEWHGDRSNPVKICKNYDVTWSDKIRVFIKFHKWLFFWRFLKLTFGYIWVMHRESPMHLINIISKLVRLDPLHVMISFEGFHDLEHQVIGCHRLPFFVRIRSVVAPSCKARLPRWRTCRRRFQSESQVTGVKKKNLDQWLQAPGLPNVHVEEGRFHHHQTSTEASELLAAPRWSNDRQALRAKGRLSTGSQSVHKCLLHARSLLPLGQNNFDSPMFSTTFEHLLFLSLLVNTIHPGSSGGIIHVKDRREFRGQRRRSTS